MLCLLAGIFLGWSLGANDASNVFGPAVSSKMVRFWTAGVLASAFVLLGALTQGQAGMETLKGLTPLTTEEAVISSVAAAATVTLMTVFGLPVSTSQAVVGAILGIGFMKQQMNLEALGKIFGCWVGTPIGGMIMAIILYRILGFIYNRLNINLLQSDILLRLSLIAAGLYGSYALGANNVANVTAVFVGSGQLSLPGALLIGGLSIDLGILTFSRRVMDTVGKRLVRLDAFSAVIVLVAEAVTVHIYAVIGVPVSTSQAVIGAVLGVGLVRGIHTVSRKKLGSILEGWFFTPVVAGFISVAATFAMHLRYLPPA